MARFDTSLEIAHAAVRAGDMARALAAAETATRANPTSSEAWWLLGTAACALDDMPLAERAFAQAAQNAPVGSRVAAQMLALRGKPLISDGRMWEAVESARMAIKAGLSDVSSLVRVSYTLTHAGCPQEALPNIVKATEIAPDHAEAWYSLGSVRRALGDIAGAEYAFNTAIRLSPTPPVPAYFNLAYLRRWKADDNHIAILEGLTCQSSLEACRVAYTLFKEFDDIGDTDAAWDCLQVGADLAAKIEPWTESEEAETVAAWKTYFPLSRLAGIDDRRPRSGPRRIFILGLPRSGTTLIERVLAAHSQVQAIGELKTFGIATHKLAGIKGVRRLAPDVIAAAAQLDPLDIAEFYTRESAFLNDGSAYVIDKLPSNHEYAGLIRLAFPDAIIIALDRNPMDALFGAYKVLFTGAYGWSYSQKDLAAHYHQFRDLMRYWKQGLGDGIIDVSLEAVIRDPDTEICRLLDACGLPFEEACLRPHEAKGAVSTASAVQVRSPINSQGVNAWKRYETYLQPLRTHLQQLGYLEGDVTP
ncbi:tetratricopeptide repeat-containing sulfotransferase family protein [Asticcacaulis sp. AC466]|uniref:tetratricopeptide repeat-containing sulfotransferase family protein n=1 Tax=Asticcacaulis sp. AC466 TaxID=1282362 RepID=UPI0012DD6A8D|nr:tetratricopeptide repeat-containing sulfotransferase family protein [Asticcacaulis sp. AC466]